jgi:TRAP-type C4-dicarboxylate transport system permease small subunit
MAMANEKHGRVETGIAVIFGLALCLLSLLVSLEVILRRFFLISLQGVDELGGYILAVASAIGFFLALMDRAHMRIDILYGRLPLAVRRILDGLAAAMMALSAVLLFWMAWITLDESMLFQSVSQTPWATPMVIPQSVWLATLAPFTLLAVWILVKWIVAFVRRDAAALNRFSAKGSTEELQEQLASVSERARAAKD